MSDKLTTGVAYRLGWGLYWGCVGLAALWIAGFLFANWQGGRDWWDSAVLWIVLCVPPLLIYGLGRFFRTVLSDE